MSDPRLEPSVFHSRWYHLKALRAALEEEFRGAVGERARGGILVDLGCGSMPYREIFEPLVGRYVGIDLAGNERAALHFDQFGRAPIEDGSVDVVLSSQVLEHVPSPQAYLEEAHRILKPDGLLFLSTHGYWMFHPDPTDYWRWTAAGLRTEVERAGFFVDHMRGVMNLAASGVQLFQDGVAGGVPAPARPAFFWLMNRIMALADTAGDAERRNVDACVYVVRAARRQRD